MFKQKAFSSCAAIAAALLLGAVFSAPLLAADATPATSGRQINSAALQKAVAARQALKSSARSRITTDGKAIPKEIFGNVNTPYPPSCLNNGLPPFGTTGLPYQQTPGEFVQAKMNLYDYNTSTQNYDAEAVTVTVWRVPCSGGISATLLEIDRDASVDGDSSKYPIFPNIYITQGSTTAYPRLPQDPNTFFSDTEVSSPLIYGSIYVLDYYNPGVSLSPDDARADYNQAFTLNVDNLFDTTPVAFSLPTYSSLDFGGYPSLAKPLEISGYMSTNWASPTEGAEGIVLQVYDNGDQATRTFAFAWFTYDDLGLPFWLYGQASIPIGATSVTSQTVYFKGGTFAGSGGGGTLTNWGTVTFKFPDCAHMNIVYNGDASADNGPKGNSSATFQRVTDVNGLACQ